MSTQPCSIRLAAVGTHCSRRSHWAQHISWGSRLIRKARTGPLLHLETQGGCNQTKRLTLQSHHMGTAEKPNMPECARRGSGHWGPRFDPREPLFDRLINHGLPELSFPQCLSSTSG